MQSTGHPPLRGVDDTSASLVSVCVNARFYYYDNIKSRGRREMIYWGSLKGPERPLFVKVILVVTERVLTG